MNWILYRFRQIVHVATRASKRQWYEAVGWLTATVIGGLMPLWGKYLFLKLDKQQPALVDFLVHGEFAL